jgi:predicted membrane protein
MNHKPEVSMSIRSEFLIGSALLIWGILWLGGNILGVDVGALCFPAGLILLGIWLLIRPRILRNGARVQFLPFGDVRRFGNWNFENEEIWMGIGDIDLDLTEAHIPTGETVVRVINFIGDIDLLIPPELGISVNSYAFLTGSKILNRKRDSLFLPVEFQSEGFVLAEQKLRLEAFGFINDIKIRRLLID